MELERAHLSPARPGLVVVDPDHGGLPLPPDGRDLVLSSYWVRRLEDGDVVRRAPGSSEPRAVAREKNRPTEKP